MAKSYNYFIMMVFVVCTFACNKKEIIDIPTQPNAVATKLSPLSGVPGEEIAINSTGFSSDTALNKVSFDGINARVTSVNNQGLTVIVPEGAHTGKLTITTGVENKLAYICNFTVQKVDVYISGYGTTAGGINLHGKVWKNGVQTLLPSESNGPDVTTTGIATNGTDIFVCGYEDSEAYSFARGWVNGVNQINNGLVIPHKYATAIGYLGGPFPSVFVAGYDRDNNYLLWVDGQFSQGLNLTSNPKAITIAGNDVYVLGEAAEYVKNNSRVALTGNRAKSTGIAIHNKDVYVCGYDYNDSGTHTLAKYWKNGKSISLPNSSSDARANAIFISGNDIYIAGEDTNGLVYWKNGNRVKLSSHTSMSPTGIAVAGNDVYISGNSSNDFHDFAIFWKNGNAITLSPTDSFNLTSGIVLVRK